MKRVILLFAAVAVGCVMANAKTAHDRYVVKRSGPGESVGVAVKAEEWVRSAKVVVGKTEVACQLDDLNGDGRYDELCFAVDFKGNGQRTANITWSDKEPKAGKYPSRVHAQMFLKENGQNVPKTVISATEDNMYNKLHHHGPAFESELIAYRIYFDKKQTIDIYGKYNKGLELAESMWYPTDEQLGRGMGDDIIRVFGTVGVGALKGWDPVKGRMSHITPVARREARIVANGPVRTVVEMEVEGWEYQGRKIGMTSRYILYAGQREVLVSNRFTGDVQGLLFCTGVMKMAENVERQGRVWSSDGQKDNEYAWMVSTWGTDYPVNDTVKYAKQTCGLAVVIEDRYCVSGVSLPGDKVAASPLVEDAGDYLIMVTADQRNEINYRFTVAAEKENFGYKSAGEFFRYVGNWAMKQPAVTKIETQCDCALKDK